MEAYNKVFYWLDKALKVVIITFISIMSITMFMQIAARYLFDTGFVWTEELSRFLVVWMVFIGVAALTYDRSHVRVTILDEMLKGKAKLVLNIIQTIIMIIYFVLVIKFSIDSMNIMGSQKSPNMGITMSFVYSIIPIAYSFAALFAIAYLSKLIFKRKS